MHKPYFTTYALIIWCLVGLSYCQDTYIIWENDDETPTQRTASIPVKVPERLLIQMKDVYNVTEFLNRFVPSFTAHESETPGISISEAPGISLKRGNSGAAAASVAQFAHCKTEQHVVELEKPDNTAVILWPACVRVRRCGGCCTSKMLSCYPLATSIVNFTVIQVQYNPQNPNEFESQGARVFSLEQHDRCACGCRERPDDCTPGVHEYNENECKCVCINQDQASECKGCKKFWDSIDCACKCRHTSECSTGQTFNIERCRCEASRSNLAAAIGGV